MTGGGRPKYKNLTTVRVFFFNRPAKTGIVIEGSF